MSSFFSDFSALWNSGTFEAGLAGVARNWRKAPNDYAIENAVKVAEAEGRGEDLLDMVLNEEFRRLRQDTASPTQHVIGVNALRADLRIARDFFLKRSPDLLRYLQVVLVEQHLFTRRESVEAQQAHCRVYAEFLQLDRLPQERCDTGLHKVVQRLFAAAPVQGGFRLRLASHELGEWSCSCGRVTSLARRYDHRCPCGTVVGHGRITHPAPACGSCNQPVGYAACPDCDTRVTLANLWRVRRGGAGPDDFLVPLTLDLRVEDERGEFIRAPHLLQMRLPLPIGVQERDGDIGFDPPAVFWASELTEWRDRPDGRDRFLVVPDTLGHDERTGFGSRLEAMLRHTLLGHRGGYDRFTNKLLDELIQRPDGSGVRSGSYTRSFWRALQKNALPNLSPGDLVSRGAVAFQCTVAASSRLQGTTAMVAKDLSAPHALAVPVLYQLDTALGQGAILTANPPANDDEQVLSLEAYGLARPGQLVLPRQLLVGASAPIDQGTKRTPEEQLLEAIFPDRVMENRSLSMPGNQPGYVLDQRIDGHFAGSAIPPAVGRRLNLTLMPSTRVTVTLAVDHSVQEGDLLSDADGATAVVCGLAGRTVLERLADAGSAPDIIVAPGHPWAPRAGQALRTVVVRLSAQSLASRETGARGAGGYSVVQYQPLLGEDGHGAQMVEPADFRWLAAHGARHVAMELHGPRSDCAAWRESLTRALKTSGAASLGPPHGSTSSLRESASHAVRRLDLTLRAARIIPTLEGGRIRLHLMTDADVGNYSSGQVRHANGIIDPRSSLPVAGGLHCQKIFGPVRDDACICGARRNRWEVRRDCGACGQTPVSSEARGRRLGHIELPVSVVHGWYLHGQACSRLAHAIGVSEHELQEIADCRTLVVTDPGPTALQHGQLLTADELDSTPGRFEVSAATGGQAVKILLRRAINADPSGHPSAYGPSLDKVVIQRLPVLPPDLRPHIRLDNGTWAGSDLNSLYSSVLTRAASYRRLRDEVRHRIALADAQRALQQSVTRLVGNGLLTDPVRDSDGRPLVGLSDHLTPRRATTGPLRNAFLLRAVDYSAQARLVVSLPSPAAELEVEEDSPATDSGTIALGRDMALRLLAPMVAHALTKSGAAERPWDAHALIRARSTAALEQLDAVCRRAVALIGLPYGPWRLLAVRFQVSEKPAVLVQPALLDQIGWNNLGESVRIFGLLSEEAQQEAHRCLTIEALRRRTVPQQDRPITEGSFFDLPCDALPDHIANAAVAQSSMPLLPDDGLVLADPSWLTGGSPGAGP